MSGGTVPPETPGNRITALVLPNGMFITSDSSNNLGFFSPTGSEILSIATSGAIVSARGINLAGIGLAEIFAIGSQSLNTNVAPTLFTYTPPATAGVYRLTAYLDILTAGTMTFKTKITYKDPGGNARTDIPAFYLQNTTAILAGGNTANTVGQYVMFPYTIAIDNSATAITIQDNAGTYTAGTYYWTPVLEQLA